MTRILLIDDETDIVSELRDYLEFKEYAVYTACEGKMGERLLKELTPEPDIVLMDINMPGMNGLDLIRKSKIERPELRFIVITGRSDEATKRESLQAGAAYFLGKPFGLDQLDQAITRVLQMKG